MLKSKLCEAEIQWKLECPGPFLIKDGRYDSKNHQSDDKQHPSCIFMTKLSDTEFDKAVKTLNESTLPPGPFLVPGTSVRGPFRAQAERIIRSVLNDQANPPTTACDPFSQDNTDPNRSCSKHMEEIDPKIKRYAEACPACKLFGCAGLASRVAFFDATIDPRDCTSAYRTMVGIDRFTGGSYQPKDGGGALMKFHVLEKSAFTVDVTVMNFELWQLGLMAYVFKDFQDGMVPIGYGKSKGFGRVNGHVERVTLRYPESPTRIEHMGSLMTSAANRKDYGIEDNNAPDFTEFESIEAPLSLYKQAEVTDIERFMKKAAESFNTHIDNLNQKMKETRK